MKSLSKELALASISNESDNVHGGVACHDGIQNRPSYVTSCAEAAHCQLYTGCQIQSALCPQVALCLHEYLHHEQ
jgi:hypothetical protein